MLTAADYVCIVIFSLNASVVIIGGVLYSFLRKRSPLNYRHPLLMYLFCLSSITESVFLMLRGISSGEDYCLPAFLIWKTFVPKFPMMIFLKGYYIWCQWVYKTKVNQEILTSESRRHSENDELMTMILPIKKENIIKRWLPTPESRVKRGHIIKVLLIFYVFQVFFPFIVTLLYASSGEGSDFLCGTESHVIIGFHSLIITFVPIIGLPIILRKVTDLNYQKRPFFYIGIAAIPGLICFMPVVIESLQKYIPPVLSYTGLITFWLFTDINIILIPGLMALFNMKPDDKLPINKFSISFDVVLKQLVSEKYDSLSKHVSKSLDKRTDKDSMLIRYVISAYKLLSRYIDETSNDKALTDEGEEIPALLYTIKFQHKFLHYNNDYYRETWNAYTIRHKEWKDLIDMSIRIDEIATITVASHKNLTNLHFKELSAKGVNRIRYLSRNATEGMLRDWMMSIFIDTEEFKDYVKERSLD